MRHNGDAEDGERRPAGVQDVAQPAAPPMVRFPRFFAVGQRPHDHQRCTLLVPPERAVHQRVGVLTHGPATYLPHLGYG